MSMPPKTADRPSFSPSAVSSLGPSGTPDIDLPFGPPEPALTSLQQKRTVPNELRRRIRALSNNANRVRAKTPLVAAQCWQEAGRLLDQHAERYSEAWICYSRALAIYPDLKPAMSALLRLARSAGAIETVYQLLETMLERTSDPGEQCALLSEAAVLDIRQNDSKKAFHKLSRASELSPEAMVPRILLALLTPNPELGDDQAALLNDLAMRLEGTPLATGFRRVAAQLDERAGRDSELPIPAGDIDIPVAWVRLRYCLKNRLFKEGSHTLSRMAQAVDDLFLKSALGRMKTTLRMIGGLGPLTLSPDALVDPVHWWLASIAGDAPPRAMQAEKSLKSASAAAEAPSLAASFGVLAQLHAIRQGAVNCPPPENSNLPEAVNRAARSFARMASRREAREPDILASNLYRALDREAWHEVLSILERLETETTDSEIRWALRMTGTAIDVEHLDAPEEALQAISEEEGNAYRQPLPAMMRRMTNRHRALADIASAQAVGVDGAEREAVLKTWAARHMEASDPFEAARLYTEALNMDPTLLFAIGGLKRTGTSERELAVLYQAAAEKSTDNKTRGRALLSAGIALYLSGELRRAGELMCEAAIIFPEDTGLTYTGLTLALHASNGPAAAAVAGLLGSDGPTGVDPRLIAPLALFSDPDSASHWYRSAEKQAPDDPLITLGAREAHFQARRPSPVSEKLLERLKQADTPVTEAMVYQRLAHVDRFIRADDSAAVLSARSLAEALPGHRSTLVQLLAYYLRKGEEPDVRRVLTLLSLTLTDEEDAVVLSRLSTLSGKLNADLLRQIANKNHATLLELISLEGRATDPKERRSLLEQITERLPSDIQVYRSRLADILGRFEQREEAVSLYKQSMENRLCVIYNLQAMLRQMQSMGDHRLLVDTMVIQSDYWEQLDRRVSNLLSAAQITRDILQDPKRTVAICQLALTADPTCRSPFEMADRLLSEGKGDPEEHIILMETRLKGTTDSLERLILHLKLRDLLGRFEDETSNERRQTHLNEAVAVVINEYPGFNESLHRADQAVEAEAWLEAVDAAVESERFEHDPMDDIPLFVALGDNLITFVDDEIRAEYYLQKALGLDETHETALKFMVDLKLKHEAYEDAASLVERLADHARADDDKLTAAMQLHDITRNRLNDEEWAEEALKKAIRVAPFDIRPIKALVALYEAQGDVFSASVQLDLALQRHSAQLAKAPTDRRLYENILGILEHRGQRHITALTKDMLDILDNTRPQRPHASWKFDARLTDPSISPLFCPQETLHALCDIIRGLTGFLRLLKETTDVLQQSERLRRRDPLSKAVQKLAPEFGFKDIALFIADIPSVQILPTAPPQIVFPKRIHAAAPAVQRFAGGFALQTLRLGVGITTVIDAYKIRPALAGLMRLLFDETYTRADISARVIDAFTEQMRRNIPEEMLQRFSPHRAVIENALNLKDLGALLFAPGHRMGFFAAGALENALEGLRVLADLNEKTLFDSIEARLLLSFIFSRDHLIVRERMSQ